ncbi:MAG: hypothetical protein ACE5HE_06850 [Phycisphaerae bacterium]
MTVQGFGPDVAKVLLGRIRADVTQVHEGLDLQKTFAARQVQAGTTPESTPTGLSCSNSPQRSPCGIELGVRGSDCHDGPPRLGNPRIYSAA